MDVVHQPRGRQVTTADVVRIRRLIVAHPQASRRALSQRLCDAWGGTCYRAANWVFLGQTTGRGNDDQTRRASRPLKDVLGDPLTKGFRERLRWLP